LPPGWKFSSTISLNFPSGIELYFFDSIYAGKKTKMFCLAYDSKNTSIEFKPVLAATAKKQVTFIRMKWVLFMRHSTVVFLDPINLTV
jgi:hypothetical protein